jgi:hypothetical protein
LDGDDELLDEPLAQADTLTDEPLDAPLDDEVVAVGGDDADIAEIEPLDAPLGEVAGLPEVDVEAVDAPLPETDVAVVPLAEPTPVPVAATSAPLSVKPKGAPVAVTGKPVTSVRKKPVPQDQVVVVAGRRPLPAELASCEVAVGAGRATVGSGCEQAPVVVEFQPAIPRVPGSAALISAENPSVITSRRDGIQIGTYPEPTLGDSIATTVRAAIFPEDVVVPEILIVPGEVVVAGNRSREDPIVLWRSELESASATSGIPIEMLATVITMSVHGNVDADLADGRVGPMQVPVAELVARGISEDQWDDPATNIRIGAELLATGASAADLQSGAAVTNYLERDCAPGACNSPETADVHELIVHYRLRATGGATEATTATDRVRDTANWPFDDEDGPGVPDPRARLGGNNEEDSDHRRGIPRVRAGGRDDEGESERNWPLGTQD